MLCKKPYSEGLMHYGCGQCMPCRVNLSREWTGRILLESYEHPFNTFLTLTYNEENCPDELDKVALSLFFKRLRMELPIGQKIRYYAVGEYGEENGRPHYHAIVFGLSIVQNEVVERAWTQGFSYLGDCTSASAAYVAGYLKKLRDPHAEGRAPEFAIMSRRPGIGVKSVDRFVKMYNTPQGQKVLKTTGWIEGSFRTAGKKFRIGRLIQRKIVDRLGFEEGNRDAHRDMLKMRTAIERSLKTSEESDQKRKSVLASQEGKIGLLRAKRRKV